MPCCAGRPSNTTCQPNAPSSARASRLPFGGARRAETNSGWTELAFDGTVADVGTELRTVEADGLYHVVGAVLRGARGVAQRGHAEHAATAGDELAALRRGAGVEHDRVIGARGIGRQAGDRVA